MKTKLHKKLYSKTGIMEAASAFEHLCRVELKTDGDYYALTFSDVDGSVKDSLLDEFANYALYGSIAGKKQW